CPPRKRQQSNIARLLDRRGQAPLMRSADPSQAPRNDFAALRHELRQQPHILVVDGLDFLHAELANLLAAEILAATFAPTAGSSRTRRPPPPPGAAGRAGRRPPRPGRPPPEECSAIGVVLDLFSSAMMLLKISHQSS